MANRAYDGFALPGSLGSPSDRGGYVRAGDVVSALLGGPLGRGLSDAQNVARAWYAANGDRERAHTTGVWLRKSGRAGIDPVLIVAVDSGLLAGELGTNKDLYLSRLAFRGIAVSDIRFVVRPRADGATAAAAARAKNTPAGDVSRETKLPELSTAERSRVESACSELPEGLRQSVSRAMCATLRKRKAHHHTEAL